MTKERSDCPKLLCETTEEDLEEEARAALEISMDAAKAAILLELKGIFTLKNKKYY